MGHKEVHVANTSDLRDGDMKEVSAGETRLLIAHAGDRFYAVSPTCPHYGAPLAEGVLCGTRLVCPWHHAVFNVVNGDLEEPPALDALVHYDLRVEGEQIVVSVPEESQDRRPVPMMTADSASDPRQFVIIDSIGLTAAQDEKLTLVLHLKTLFRDERADLASDRL